MKITLEVSKKMGREMQALGADLPAAIRLGLADWRWYPTPTHRELANAIRELTTATTPEQVLALRPTPKLARLVRRLLDKEGKTGLNAAERDEMDACQRVDHLVRLAKQAAAVRLKKFHGA